MITKKHIKHAIWNDEQGFSLIEMAIVLGIIAVLIGLALKGQDMLKDAQMRSLQSDIRTYATMLDSFREQFSALPGDFASASKRLGSKNDVAVINGNGNGVVETESEQLQFWQHLALADMIKGISITKDPNAIIGETLPTASIGGGYQVVYETVYGQSKRNWFKLTQTTAKDADGGGVLTPRQAWQIDKSTDDALPKTGKVQSKGEGCLDDTKKQYAETDEEPVCVLYFSLR
jgi:prepilin-type N-terminal cleavage/methylation domain-containing protein